MRALSLLLVCAGLEAAEPIRALIFSGRNNHDWRATTPHLKKLLLETGRFDVRVLEEPAGTTDKTLAAADVLVLDYNGPRWSEATERALAAFVRSGKGLVVVHGAAYAFHGNEVLGDAHRPTGLKEPAWPEYAEMIGASWSNEEPRTGHGLRHSFQVQFTGRAHPIAAGMPESFWATDELYHRMRMRPGARVLATAFDDPKIKGTGKHEPILWTVEYGRGRVFHTTLGHDLAAMSEAGFISTFVRGAEWAATGAVTIPPVTDPWRPKHGALRALVVTGGHSYDTTFYSVFDDAGIHWTHAATAAEAFRKPIRGQTDVLVLYDMTAELPAEQQNHLRDYLENGGPMVVLHHAIANYQNWPWWYEEVVGGRYILRKEGDSTYQHDEELFVTPEGSHPITAGIGPMHLVDETYKGMWISPKVQVLLRTNNATSDGPVAWISPWAKSRVVYIQLGHGREAHQHPAFRRLVHNAMRWAAGR